MMSVYHITIHETELKPVELALLLELEFKQTCVRSESI